jgi:hypothetical protein
VAHSTMLPAIVPTIISTLATEKGHLLRVSANKADSNTACTGRW